MKTVVSRIGLTLLNVIVFFVEEGWIIAMVAIFPFWLALILVTILLSFFAISSTVLCGTSELSPVLKNWLDKQEKQKEESKLVQWAVKVARGAILVSSLIVALVISPTTAAIMLHQAGISRKQAFAVDVVYSAISGTIWCLIYGLGINVLKIAYEYAVKLIGGG